MRLHDTNGNCTACPYDCYVCDTNNYCLSCNASGDHRELSGNRCVPLPGYYESGQTQAAACDPSCATCDSANTCTSCNAPLVLSGGQCAAPSTPCPFRQFDYYGTCTACPYDCFTCNPSGYCLTCNDTNDHRQLSGVRCVPLPGYFESGSSVASACPAGCTECLAADYCTACDQVPYYLSEHQCKLPVYCPPRQYQYGGVCLDCPYDCYTCNSQQICMTCNATTDFRELSNYRCVPLPGYYESNVAVAAACPTGCSSCYSASYCTACSAGYQLSNSQCTPSQVGAAGCPSGCAACDQATQACSSCISGFELAGHDCISADGSGTGSVISIVLGAIAAIFIVGFVILVSYRYYHAKQRAEDHGHGLGMDSDIRLDHDK
jgi:hypothetical protein